MDPEAVISEFEKKGQGHVFHFYNQLSPECKNALLEQACQIDLEEISALFNEWKQKSNQDVDFSNLTPAPYIRHPASDAGDMQTWFEARSIGEEALAAGRVAAFTVAGGQGTRLGFEGPKGTFPATPVKNKTLFQVFAEKILATQQECGQSIDWLIMTSIQNDAATRAFFAENNFFGLGEDQVHLFKQGVMPAVDKGGKILMETKGEIAMSPDGHGGSIRAMVRSGNVKRLLDKGVDTVSYFQVDNPLVYCLDPVFIGFHLKEKAEISSKMIPKGYAEEKVGHFCVQDGRQVVIEYSDLPQEMQAKVHPDSGELVFRAGSIAIHILDLNFVKKLGEDLDPRLSLPFHFAEKKVPFIDLYGNSIMPELANGIKFEMFIFDSLPLAEKSIIVETLREDEFSPIKNAEGKDSPVSSREDQSRQHLRWLKAAGESVENLNTVEISPLFAQTQEQFISRWNASKPISNLSNNIYISHE